MTGTDRKAIAAAIFDPGATEGLKGERTLTEWQTDAVMRVLSALTASASEPAQPVAWRWRTEIFREWELSDEEPGDQLEMERLTDLNMRGLEVEALYVHPASSASATVKAIDTNDAPDRIRVAQDADGFWTCREAVSGSQEYVRVDLYNAVLAQSSASPIPASEPEPVAKFANDMRDALIAADNLLREHRLSLPKVKAAISLATTFRLHPQEDADTLKARAAAVLCEAGTLCGWPAPNCNAQEGAEALFKAGLLAKPVSTPDGAVAVSMTPEEHRLEDLKQMAAYSGPIVSFECREPYYLASCDHCGWVGSSELCGTDSFGDDSDVYCPRCHSSGADCGKVAETLSAALSHPADGWRDIPVTDELISYVKQYGGRCRDCGDVAGICSSGLPCEAEDAAKAIRHVLGAVNYGFRHGYLAFPAAPAAKPEGE